MEYSSDRAAILGVPISLINFYMSGMSLLYITSDANMYYCKLLHNAYCYSTQYSTVGSILVLWDHILFLSFICVVGLLWYIGVGLLFNS